MSSGEQAGDKAEADLQKKSSIEESRSSDIPLLPVPKKVPSDIVLPSLVSPQKSTTKLSSTDGNHSRPPKVPSKNQFKRHSSSRRHGRSPKKTSGSGPKPFKECVCGRGVACLGMTQAFRMLGDPRCYHVELPRYRKDPPAFKYEFRNNLRQAYLRQLVRQNPTNEKLTAELENAETSVPKKRRYVALHHFHPKVVRAFYENPLTSAQKHKVPISITEHELGELRMECYEEDKILSASGTPTGGYYFTPNYPHEKAHEDLKVLIQAVRSSRGKDRNKRSSRKRGVDPNVPTDIEITTPKNDDDDNREAKPARSFNDEKYEREDVIDNEVSKDAKLDSENELGRTESDAISGLLGDGSDEFDKLWDKPYSREIESSLVPETVNEEEEYIPKEESEIKEKPEVDDPGSPRPMRDSLLSRRSADRPWATPKYRRDREQTPILVSGAADYIDPNNTGDLNNRLASKSEIVDDGEDIARIAADMTIVDVQRNLLVSPLTPVTPDRGRRDPKFEWSTPAKASPSRASFSPRSRWSSGDDELSLDSADSDIQNFIKLDHQLPGADPTLRIQVHNDLIAWESKRRSDLSQQLEYNEERWKAARDILTDGATEAKYAERLISGVSKASRLLADSLNAVYDDKLLDDKGNTVKNSFLRNRLAKKRSAVEYSIENTSEDSKEGSGLGSILLDSIVSAQLEIANAFIRNSEHVEQEILPEITEFIKEVIDTDAMRLQSIGDAVISELKQSEIEVKNIWGKFSLEAIQFVCNYM